MFLGQRVDGLQYTLGDDVEREAVRKTVIRLLADKETGPALLHDLKGGLPAMPIWMQDIVRRPLSDAAEVHQG